MPDGKGMTGLHVLHLGNGKLEIKKPDEPDEKKARVSWEVREPIRMAFLKQFDRKTFGICDSSQKVECTPYGRVKNATSDSFLMARKNQVLREEYLLSAGNGYKKKTQIPISRMQTVSTLENDLLTWIDELRYATSAMLTDLAEAGLVALGGMNFKKTKLSDRFKLLSQYGLVDVSQFATLDDEGKLLEDSKTCSIARIYTLGKNGANMLGELGRGYHYNAFERFQDGNTVKAILAVNQWLVYWLSAYPEEFLNHYESSRVVYIRYAQTNGARIHASVVRNDCILIGEPLRRGVQRETLEEMCKKFKRFMMLFSADASSLYCSYDEVVFPERKILCYICEDEEHVAEVHEALLPYLREYPDQEIWYTTDLKMYNYNEEGKRFLVYGTDGTASFVNLQERLGLGRERAWRTET